MYNLYKVERYDTDDDFIGVTIFKTLELALKDTLKREQDNKNKYRYIIKPISICVGICHDYEFVKRDYFAEED